MGHDEYNIKEEKNYLIKQSFFFGVVHNWRPDFGGWKILHTNVWREKRREVKKPVSPGTSFMNDSFLPLLTTFLFMTSTIVNFSISLLLYRFICTKQKKILLYYSEYEKRKRFSILLLCCRLSKNLISIFYGNFHICFCFWTWNRTIYEW